MILAKRLRIVHNKIIQGATYTDTVVGKGEGKGQGCNQASLTLESYPCVKDSYFTSIRLLLNMYVYK